MKAFMDDDFLLDGEVAKTLWNNFAKGLPIIDYHCHVSPREIAEDKRYSNITELWLGGDHYKWRAMRSCGVDEKYITGDSSDYEKFKAYASIMPRLIGNPLYHWTHLELQRYFDYHGILDASSCDEVWALANEKLAGDDMTVRGIIKMSNVEALCTTDDPADSLEFHRAIADDESFDVEVLPAFRPDKGMKCNVAGYANYIKALAFAAGIDIADINSLKAAYVSRMDFFDSLGCRTADMGIDEEIPFEQAANNKIIDDIFKKSLASDGKDISKNEADIFKTAMFGFFGAEYKKRGWVMQIHFGPLRNVSSKMMRALGPDSGYDVIGGRSSTTELARLLDMLESSDALPKTIIYSINPSDNAAIGALIGAFQSYDGTGMPTVYQGSAWWFNDNIKGMREQLSSYANLSALGYFPGMLTDSRSFTSYPRHEYFRRILCDMIGEWVERGEFPADWDALSDIVTDICYNNTKNLFRI